MANARIVANSAFLPALQISITCLVLAACAFWPRAGKAALLVPVAGDTRIAANWAHGHGLSLLGSGRMAGSLVVQTGDHVPFWEALRAGNLLLAAPSVTCTPETRTNLPPLS